MEGWIRLAREIVEKPVFQNPDILKVWIWCLLKATHKGYTEVVGRQKIPLEPGQFVFGRFKAAQELHMKPTTIRDYMYWLRDNESISIKSANKYSLITIINWTIFQVEDKKPATKSAKKSTANRQQIATNNNDNNISTKVDIYGDVSQGLFDAIDGFVEMRKMIKKPMTDRAIKMMLNRLNGMAKNDAEKIAILEQSTMSSWLDIYPLKQKPKPQERELPML
jgi:hypothetical protein